jgi:predicted nucleic acid-binding protein
VIILDTNVVSELIRPTPDLAVARWIKNQLASNLFISAITEAELRYGVALLPEGKRRDHLAASLERILRGRSFHGRTLSFDSAAASAYAAIVAGRRASGRPISQSDAQIAAIATCHRAIVATRNIDDFVGSGITLVNPWTEQP